ncbi:MAG: HAMP domain-containing sensor histidine kinase, partial [Hydrogenophaga sp.]|uniref:sensor histidine kinase n=1 Tax=Hydrogenophaga sp. TaxID=1904254 RepID=UPI0026327934
SADLTRWQVLHFTFESALFFITWLLAAFGLVASVVHFQHGSSQVVQSVVGAQAEERELATRIERGPMVAGVVAVLAMLLFTMLLIALQRARAEIERQAHVIEACRQRLERSERWSLLGRRVAGVAHQLTAPLAMSKNNIFMVVQRLDDTAPGIRAASRRPETGALATAETTVPQPQNAAPMPKSSIRGRLADQNLVLQDLLGDVLMELDQMEELVNGLLLFTRLGRSPKETVNLGTVLHSVVRLARAALPGQVKVVESWAELPPIECHVPQLNQALVSVILQAAQRINGAGVITVSTAIEGSRARLCIGDAGGAVPGAVRASPFSADFMSAATQGCSGPGLAHARDIVTAHGGSVSVETRSGLGTKVLIDLPLKAPPA